MGTDRKTQARLWTRGTSRVIAYSRLALGSFALVAIYVDPTQPARFSAIAYLILLCYVAFSAVGALVASFSGGNAKEDLLWHTVDLVAFAVLTYLTEGPTSPLFVFFTFAILSGAMRWGRDGAFVTAALLIAWHVGIAFFGLSSPDQDLNRVIVRSGYLLVAAVLIGYFGEYRDRSRKLLERLATWPTISYLDRDKPGLEDLLRHTSAVLGVPRIVVLWQWMSEVDWRYAYWNGKACSFGFRPSGVVSGALVPAWPSSASAAHDLSTDDLVTASRLSPQAGLVLEPGFARSFDVASFGGLPFSSEQHRGLLLILDPPRLTTELLPEMQIVAGRLASELEHYRFRNDLASAVATQERARVSRDLHDTILQDFTAMTLRLRARSASAPQESRSIFDEVIELLATEQQRIRELITAADTLGGQSESKAVEAIEPHLRDLETRWACGIRFGVRPPDARLGVSEISELTFITSEAVANAVRHGAATAIEIELALGDELNILVRDNGRAQGNSRHARKPTSLAQRVLQRGGTCHLDVNNQGAVLSLNWPRMGR